MAHTDLTNHLKQTISDHRVSRSERRALQALAAEIDLDQHQLSLLKSKVFEIARNELISPDAKEVNEWVESVLKAIRPPTDRPTIESEALFSPDDACALKIVSLIQRARSSIDVCVFTITDNRIADALCDATRRRIAIRSFRMTINHLTGARIFNEFLTPESKCERTTQFRICITSTRSLTGSGC